MKCTGEAYSNSGLDRNIVNVRHTEALIACCQACICMNTGRWSPLSLGHAVKHIGCVDIYLCRQKRDQQYGHCWISASRVTISPGCEGKPDLLLRGPQFMSPVSSVWPAVPSSYPSLFKIGQPSFLVLRVFPLQPPPLPRQRQSAFFLLI